MTGKRPIPIPLFFYLGDPDAINATPEQIKEMYNALKPKLNGIGRPFIYGTMQKDEDDNYFEKLWRKE